MVPKGSKVKIASIPCTNNNDTIFKLADGSPNDGYVSKDGLNLTHCGTNRLVKTLQLRMKKAHSDNICKSKQNQRKSDAAANPSKCPDEDDWFQVTRKNRQHKRDGRQQTGDHLYREEPLMLELRRKQSSVKELQTRRTTLYIVTSVVLTPGNTV